VVLCCDIVAVMAADSRAGVPPPPGLHWTIVLLLGIVTAGLFFNVWAIVQSVWARKFDTASKALMLNIAGIAVAFVGYGVTALGGNQSAGLAIDIAGLVLVVIAIFSVRDSLSWYITKIEGRATYLSGVMTLFFGEVYLQYHMNRVRSLLRRSTPASV
jgi:drug/metabolite transporter (DMT)-like permease